MSQFADLLLGPPAVSINELLVEMKPWVTAPAVTSGSWHSGHRLLSRRTAR
jgi:hypothetical protein